MVWNGRTKEYEGLANVNEEQLYASGCYETKKSRKYQQKTSERLVGYERASNLEGTWEGMQNIECKKTQMAVKGRLYTVPQYPGAVARRCCRANERRGSPSGAEEHKEPSYSWLLRCACKQSGRLTNKMNSARRCLLCGQFLVTQPLRWFLLYYPAPSNGCVFLRQTAITVSILKYFVSAL